MRKLAVLALAAMAATACDEGTGLNGTRVGVELALPTQSASVASSVSSSAVGFEGATAASIDISGSNGVLTLDTVHVILAEFELEHMDNDGEDCDSVSVGTSCEEFEAPPSLVRLPLDGGTMTAVSAEVQPGQYGQIEFEIEDLDDDEDDPVEQQQIHELRDAILAEFDDWPRQASMRIVGSFTPDGAIDAIPFVVYVEAEIEVELDFQSPFVVTEEDVTRTVTVELDPADWVRLGNGTVINLADYDYASTGLVPELEAEIENGFHSVEHDD